MKQATSFYRRQFCPDTVMYKVFLKGLKQRRRLP